MIWDLNWTFFTAYLAIAAVAVLSEKDLGAVKNELLKMQKNLVKFLGNF